MADDEIPVDLQLRDAAYVFAREKDDKIAGSSREALRRRLLQFVQDFDRASGEDDVFDFVARRRSADRSAKPS